MSDTEFKVDVGSADVGWLRRNKDSLAFSFASELGMSAVIFAGIIAVVGVAGQSVPNLFVPFGVLLALLVPVVVFCLWKTVKQRWLLKRLERQVESSVADVYGKQVVSELDKGAVARLIAGVLSYVCEATNVMSERFVCDGEVGTLVAERVSHEGFALLFLSQDRTSAPVALRPAGLLVS